MGSSIQPGTDILTDTIRRTIRVLGSQPAHALAPASTLAVARLIFERLRRTGVPVLWIAVEPDAPLIVAGHGPVAVSTYLDDSHPLTTEHTGQPPAFEKGFVRGPGIERTAAVVAAIAPLQENPALGEQLTLIVETDRHNGSRALERWLTSGDRVFSSVLWEVSDLPLSPPLLALSASGTLVVEVVLKSTRRRAEQVYGTVLPDPGFALANLLASLKSSDEEVRLEGFYDGITSPDDTAFDSLIAAVPEVNNWIRHITQNERNLSTSHMALGMFYAPSVVVRSLSMEPSDPYLPEQASAVVQFQLLPGQSADQVLSALHDQLADSPFQVSVVPLLRRDPVFPARDLNIPAHLPRIPIAPGPSPAALFEQQRVPGVGYAVVGRRANRDEQGIELDAIRGGSAFLLELVAALADERWTRGR